MWTWIEVAAYIGVGAGIMFELPDPPEQLEGLAWILVVSFWPVLVIACITATLIQFVRWCVEELKMFVG